MDSPFCTWISAANSQVGRRRRINEDAVLDRPAAGLWAVADGIGGQSAGDVASRAVVDRLMAVDLPAALPGAVAEVEAALGDCNDHLRQMARTLGTRTIIGTTVVALVGRGRRAVCLWAGDSRAYLLRGRGLYRLTADHTLGEEGGAPDATTTGRASYALTRAVGALPELKLQAVSVEADPDDVFLLCSDGLNHSLAPEAIAGFLGADPGASVGALMAESRAAEAADDVSVVVIRVRT